MTRTRRAARHVLVIGGAGYIGSVLIRELLAQGYRVRCLDALLYDTAPAVAALNGNGRFSFVCGDMRRRDTLAASLEGITDVVLLASLVGDPICKKYPALARDINLTGSIEAFSVVDAAGVGRFVYLSTCSNYGISIGASATEESALNPQSIYAETKVGFEQFLEAQASSASCTTTILRLATAFGLSPRMRFDLTIADFARQLALGRELVVFDPDTWRPYCHVRDIARAVRGVLEADRLAVSGQVFNVGGDDLNYTKAMIVTELQAILPAARIRYRDGDGDGRNYRVSFRKVQQALGFAPRHSVRESIASVARAVQAGRYADVDARASFYGNRVIVREPAVS